VTEAVLKQRVITAVVLAVVFASTLFAENPVYFSVLGLLMIVVGAWEWSRLSDINNAWVRGLYTATIAALCLALAVLGIADQAFASLAAVFYCMVVFWLGMAYLVLSYPQKNKNFCTANLRLVYGTVILLGAWLGLLYLRFHTQGQFWILLSVAVVAAADIAAYFAGRKFGKNKLAIEVSPGKSWEGFWGGLIAAQLLAIMFYWLASLADQQIALWQWLFAILVLSSVSVLGDLTESMIKREANCKDSGTLLPGHGGVLDRIDGLLPVLPLTALFVLVFGW